MYDRKVTSVFSTTYRLNHKLSLHSSCAEAGNTLPLEQTDYDCSTAYEARNINASEKKKKLEHMPLEHQFSIHLRAIMKCYIVRVGRGA